MFQNQFLFQHVKGYNQTGNSILLTVFNLNSLRAKLFYEVYNISFSLDSAIVFCCYKQGLQCFCIGNLGLSKKYLIMSMIKLVWEI